MFPSDTAMNGEKNEHFVFVEGAMLSFVFISVWRVEGWNFSLPSAVWVKGYEHFSEPICYPALQDVISLSPRPPSPFPLLSLPLSPFLFPPPPLLSPPRRWVLQTQKLRSVKNPERSKVFLLKNWVGQNIAMHASPATRRDCKRLSFQFNASPVHLASFVPDSVSTFRLR